MPLQNWTRRVRPSTTATFLRFVMVTAAWLLGGASALAVTPLPVPSIPPLNASTGRVLERLADGSIVVGGDFTYVNGNPISHLTKFDADGQLQTGWRPEPNGVVNALASSGEHVYIAGSFQSFGGQAIARLARVRIDTGQVDPQWAPVVNATVKHLTLDGNGGLIAAGDFGTVGGVPRVRLARIVIETGSLDTSWQHTLPLQAPTALLASGTSLFVADQGNVYKLSIATGLLDTTWTVNNPNASAIIALAERQGFLYVGGAFTHLKVGGAVAVARNRVARVSLTSPYTLDATWNPDANGPVNAIAFDASEAVYIVGEFTTVGGAARGQIAKLSSAGTGAPAALFVFNNSASRQFYDVLATSTQLYVAGGRFLLDFGVPDRRFGMAAFNLSNAQLSTRLYDLGTRGSISAIARQPDGSYIVGGAFVKAGTRERQNLFRQLASGELDLGWNPGASSEVRAIAATDMHVFVGGTFSTIGGVQRFSLAKIDSFGIGVVDATWIPQVTGNFGFPQIMKIDESRQMVVIGLAEGLLRIPISGNGQPDPNWNALASASIVALDIAPDGMVYAGGDGRSPGNHLRRYFPSTSGLSAQDGSWQPRPSNPISAVDVGADGWIYVGGEFSSIGQQLRSLVARVSAVSPGLADPTWDPQGNIGTSQAVRGIAFHSPDHVYLGGNFTELGELSARGLARVSATGVGALDTQWRPNISPANVSSLQLYSNELAVTGGFGTVGSTIRLGAMALSLDAPDDGIFYDGFE